MRGLRSWAFLVVTVAACTGGNGASGDLVVNGTAKKADGAAAANQQVVLVQDTYLAGYTTNYTEEVTGVPLGMTCLQGGTESCQTITGSQPTDYGRSDDKGAFALGVRFSNYYGLGTTDGSYFFDLAGRMNAGGAELDGPYADYRFESGKATLTAPDLVFWAPTLSVTADPQHVTLDFTAPPSTPAFGTNVKTGVLVDVIGFMLWREDAQPGVPLDARPFEDLSGTIVVTAQSDIAGPSSSWRARWHSGKQSFMSSAGAPPSRNKACEYEHEGQPWRVQPCGLTDGDMLHNGYDPNFTSGQPVSSSTMESSSDMASSAAVSTGSSGSDSAAGSATPPSSAEGNASSAMMIASSSTSTETPDPTESNQWVRIDMGSVVPVSLVVVRRLIPGGFVETSEDGVHFSAFGDGIVKLGTFKVESATPVNARYVRVRAQTSGIYAGSLSNLTEISVW